MSNACAVGLLLLAFFGLACQPPPPLKIGFLAGLSGPASALGNEGRLALELAVQDFNRDGGAAGRPVEIVAADGGGDGQQTRRALEEFRSLGVSAVIGPMTSSAIGTVLGFVNENSLPTISPTASAQEASGKPDWFFRVIVANPQMGVALAEYALGQGLLEFSVLRETSNQAYTNPILESFQRTLEAGGGRVKTPVLFNLSQHPDYPGLARALGKSSAYLVLANGFDTAQIGQALARAGRLEAILACPWAMTPELVSLGGRQVERMVFVSIYDTENQTANWLNFRERFSALYGKEPGFGALYTQDAFRVLALALKGSSSMRADDIREALAKLRSVSGLQSQFEIDANGDVVRPLFLMTVRGGKFMRNDR